MIHIRGKGLGEVVAVFEVAKRQEMDWETRERVEVGQAVRQSYVAHLEGRKSLGRSCGLRPNGAAGRGSVRSVGGCGSLDLESSSGLLYLISRSGAPGLCGQSIENAIWRYKTALIDDEVV